MIDNTRLEAVLRLHRVVAPDRTTGACWSPLSVASALGLLTQGARGKTRAELVELLTGSPDAGLDALAADLLDASTPGPQGEDDELTLSVANTLWLDPSISVLDSYRAEVSRWAGGAVRAAPFQADPDEACRAINADVAETTRDLITSLVPRDAIDENTVTALVNALYLKAGWYHPFPKEATVPRPFHAPAGTVVVPTMELTAETGHTARDGWQAVHLPADGGVTAVVLLPDGDLDTAEAGLTAETLAGLLTPADFPEVELRLPSLRVESSVPLTGALQELGVREVFGPHADLSGITDAGINAQAVLHQAVLTIDETGLEGAAATVVIGGIESVRVPPGRVVVHVDRPFLLAVRHERTGVPYFLARVVKP